MREDAKNVKGFTESEEAKLQDLLDRAISRKDERLVEKRLAQGASMSAKSEQRRRTPLMAAASAMSSSLIERFLPFSDEAAVDADGNTALNLLMLENGLLGGWGRPPRGWKECFQLLASPATAAIKNRDGNTPLMTAAFSWCRGDAEFKQLLDMLLPMVDLGEKNNEGLTACMLAARGRAQGRALALWDAGRRGSGQKNLAASRGLVHAAAKSDHDQLLREIASEVDLEERDSRGRTPFLAAARKGSFAAAAELLSKGANPRAVDEDGCDAMMLITEALSCGDGGAWNEADSNFLGAVARSVDVSARDFLGESALSKARDRRQAELAEIILTAGAGAAAEQEPSDISWRPKLQEMLLAAIHDGDVELAKRRIAQGADPAKPLGEGTTALGAAAATCNLEMIRLMLPSSQGTAAGSVGGAALIKLLESSSNRGKDDFMACASELASAEAVAAINDHGRSALMEAACYQQNFKELLALLGPLSDWRAKDDQGASVVEAAVDIMEPENAMDLWSAHPDKDWAAASTNNGGLTLAHIAAARNYAPMLMAIANHSNFGARDAMGRTPLMLACVYGGCFESAVKLLAPWSDCRAVDAQGCDALMLAIEESQCESYGDFVGAVSELVRWADLGARDFLGESALDKAIDREFPLVEAAIRARMAIQEEKFEIEAASSAPREAGGPKLGRI